MERKFGQHFGDFGVVRGTRSQLHRFAGRIHFYVDAHADDHEAEQHDRIQ
jgi:hypothetical protein